MSGGKGGGQTTENTIPEWAKQPTIRNLARAEEVQKIGYMPYYGPDIAAFNPTQQTAMQSNMDAAAAFGLAAPGQDAMAGMPQAQDFGGISGYASAPIFEQAVTELEQKAPGYVKEYNELFADNTPTASGGSGKAGGAVSVGNPGSGLSGGSFTPQIDNTGLGGTYNTPEPQVEYGSMGRKVEQEPVFQPSTARVDPNPSSYVSSNNLQNLAIPTAQPVQAPAINVDDQMLNMRYNKRNR